jgi:hypothetical protein
LGGKFLPGEEENGDLGEKGAAFSGRDGRGVEEPGWYSLVGEIEWKG